MKDTHETVQKGYDDRLIIQIINLQSGSILVTDSFILHTGAV